uniref:thioredoxin domain-containing protein n=1 Tax=Aurantibacter sp. TaxID=2807103 RepID=UPI0035C7C531
KSKESKLFNIIDLSDASIVYFSSLSIVFLFNPTILVFKSLSILSLPIVFYSIYHQYFKIKKWCPLCLVIASILLLQFFVLKMILHESKFNFLLVFPILLIFIISIISWINLKKLLVNNFENKRLRIENLTFRRDYNLFLPHYFALKPINVDYSSLDIKMGNNNSSVKITAITNPLCETCFEVHNIYMKLLKRYPNKLEINFHFFVPFDNRKDPRTQISERLLQFYAEDRNRFFEAFDEWYSKVSIKKWLKKWGKCDDLKYNEILKEHHFWCVSKEVDSTPTILINGKVFSKNYNPLDMENFIGHIIRLEKK